MGSSGWSPWPRPSPYENVAMAVAMPAMLSPVVVVLVMQRWFIKGVIETEK